VKLPNRGVDAPTEDEETQENTTTPHSVQSDHSLAAMQAMENMQAGCEGCTSFVAHVGDMVKAHKQSTGELRRDIAKLQKQNDLILSMLQEQRAEAEAERTRAEAERRRAEAERVRTERYIHFSDAIRFLYKTRLYPEVCRAVVSSGHEFDEERFWGLVRASQDDEFLAIARSLVSSQLGISLEDYFKMYALQDTRNRRYHSSKSPRELLQWVQTAGAAEDMEPRFTSVARVIVQAFKHIGIE